MSEELTGQARYMLDSLAFFKTDEEEDRPRSGKSGAGRKDAPQGAAPATRKRSPTERAIALRDPV